MIEARELRIGNLVDCDGECTITQLRDQYARVKCLLKNEERQFLVEYDRISPIPVTAEWLTKLGFKPFEWSYSRNGVTFRKSKQGEWYEPLYGKVIDHVHQLQNFIFAVSGEELTPK